MNPQTSNQQTQKRTYRIPSARRRGIVKPRLSASEAASAAAKAALDEARASEKQNDTPNSGPLLGRCPIPGCKFNKQHQELDGVYCECGAMIFAHNMIDDERRHFADDPDSYAKDRVEDAHQTILVDVTGILGLPRDIHVELSPLQYWARLRGEQLCCILYLAATRETSSGYSYINADEARRACGDACRALHALLNERDDAGMPFDIEKNRKVLGNPAHWAILFMKRALALRPGGYSCQTPLACTLWDSDVLHKSLKEWAGDRVLCDFSEAAGDLRCTKTLLTMLNPACKRKLPRVSDNLGSLEDRRTKAEFLNTILELAKINPLPLSILHDLQPNLGANASQLQHQELEARALEWSPAQQQAIVNKRKNWNALEDKRKAIAKEKKRARLERQRQERKLRGAKPLSQSELYELIDERARMDSMGIDGELGKKLAARDREFDELEEQAIAREQRREAQAAKKAKKAAQQAAQAEAEEYSDGNGDWGDEIQPASDLGDEVDQDFDPTVFEVDESQEILDAAEKHVDAGLAVPDDDAPRSAQEQRVHAMAQALRRTHKSMTKEQYQRVISGLEQVERDGLDTDALYQRRLNLHAQNAQKNERVAALELANAKKRLSACADHDRKLGCQRCYTEHDAHSWIYSTTDPTERAARQLLWAERWYKLCKTGFYAEDAEKSRRIAFVLKEKHKAEVAERQQLIDHAEALRRREAALAHAKANAKPSQEELIAREWAEINAKAELLRDSGMNVFLGDAKPSVAKRDNDRRFGSSVSFVSPGASNPCLSNGSDDAFLDKVKQKSRLNKLGRGWEIDGVNLW